MTLFSSISFSFSTFILYNSCMACLLYNKTYYNLLESTLSPDKLVELAKENGHKTVSICDDEGLYGVAEFTKAAKKQGIKAVIGLKLNIDYQDSSLTLAAYAKNDRAYQTLMRFSTLLNCQESLGFTELFAVEDELFFCLLPESAYLYEDFIDKNLSSLKEKLQKINKSLSFYLGIPATNSALNRQIADILRALAKENNYKTVALPLVKMAEPEDEKLLKVLKAIKEQSALNDPNIVVEKGCHFLNDRDLKTMFDEEELNNSDYIASNCNVDMKFETAVLPRYRNKDDSDSKSFLTKLCKMGLAKRLNNQIPPVYQERLKNELAIITKLNYEDYFLLVYDFILYAKKNQISVGPGRGSAAGSLVAYCLGITQVDPLKYDLLFERFLNPERISQPDIDTDIADNRRDQVVNYLLGEYPNYRSAHILTFGTFKAKMAIRDVAKVLGLALVNIDALTKTIPFSINGNLEDAYQNSSAFRHLINGSSLYREIFEVAKQVEFFPRHMSTHAAGIVLSQDPIYNHVPLTMVNGLLTTQFTMNHLEEYGLIKMDLLGLRNLTIIDDIVRNQKLNDPITWPMDKKEVYELLSRADTLGIFQLESSGMKATLRKLQPRCFDDIVAIVALYRPGPMQFIDQYLLNRAQPNYIEYGHPDLIPILKSTYGIMIYQEQIMQVVQIIAGFSLGKADILRKAISKKQSKEMEGLRKDFINGCLKKGHSKEIATKIFAMIERFANYGFNKAHSVGYAMIAYQTAYLKTFYPLAFYKSLLNNVIGQENKLAEYLSEVRSAGIKVLPPSVNHSFSEFVIEENCLRFPLSAVKGLGVVAVGNLLDIREKQGKFVDFYDFVIKCCGINSANKIMENLIKVGALDELGLNRQSLLASLPSVLRYGSLGQGNNLQSSFDYSILDKPPLFSIKENKGENLIYEAELLGFYFSEHPCTLLRQKDKNLQSLNSLTKTKYGKTVALISHVKLHKTKNNEMMAFLTLEDESGKYDASLMPNIYELTKDELSVNNLLVIEVAYDEIRTSFSIRKLRKAVE